MVDLRIYSYQVVGQLEIEEGSFSGVELVFEGIDLTHGSKVIAEDQYHIQRGS